MLVKIILLFFIILSGLAITAIKPLPSPQTATTPKTSMVEKPAAITKAPPYQNAKPENKTATTSAEIKKPATKTEPKAAGAAAAPAATSSLAISATLPASNTQPKTSLSTSTAPKPVNFENINLATRQTVVNILCTSKNGGLFEPLSGSGVIIDPRGIILTNAHIAQYLLLKDYGQKDFLTCIARTGSPAVPAYTLKLLYISPEWVRDNYKVITSTKPTGTGENDFALIEITGPTNTNANLPTVFQALKIDTNEKNIKEGNPVVLVGYPAGFLGGIAIQRDLYIVSTVVNIGERYTFRTGALDAFSLGGSPVAQQGSSGGAVVGAESKLLGIIVTSTEAAETSGRDLDAISLAHINRSFASTTGITLVSLLNSNLSELSEFSKAFDEELLPDVKKILYDELDSKNQ
jgi:S1-C subfamily serine protease